MDQVVGQDFQLQRIPETMLRPTKHPIDEFAPQLTEGGLAPLSELTEEKLLDGDAVTGNQQQVRLLSQVGRALWPPLAQVAQQHAPGHTLAQQPSGPSLQMQASRHTS